MDQPVRGLVSAIAAEAVIAFDRIGVSFGAEGRIVSAIADVSFGIRRQQITTVVGPSGCGKTTLLRLASGLLLPTAGQVLFQGRRVDGLNTDVGYITQDSNLFPWMTTLENVAFALTVRGVSKVRAADRARAWMSRVGLEGFEDSYPFQLSGGMQKRASIIRTLIYEPEVVLMDEPFGALDAQTRMLLQNELLEIWQRDRKTILFITHDLVEAIALSDVIVVMTRRPGRIKEIYEVPIARPRNVFEIFAAPGFDVAYAYLWEHFKSELGR